jgi:fructose-bisphosphate aldolase, class II
MLVNMTDCVHEASSGDRIVPGFNVFGFEDAQAVIKAAENFNAPVILMSNKDATEHMDMKSSAALYTSLAESSRVPVIIHLDHAKTFADILRAVEAGYTSVMYDGSALSLADNIENTRRVLELARSRNVSVEAEIGSVPYTDRDEAIKSILTVPEEAAVFLEQAPVDALAVAVGSLHRMQTKSARIDFERLRQIEVLTDVPLVIHGTSGIVDQDVKDLLKTNVGKMNIGTALRMAYGKELKEEVLSKPDEFDRVKLLRKPMAAVQAAAEDKYRLLGWKEI